MQDHAIFTAMKSNSFDNASDNRVPSEKLAFGENPEHVRLKSSAAFLDQWALKLLQESREALQFFDIL